jgi:hypothetical protein
VTIEPIRVRPDNWLEPGKKFPGVAYLCGRSTLLRPSPSSTTRPALVSVPESTDCRGGEYVGLTRVTIKPEAPLNSRFGFNSHEVDVDQGYDCRSEHCRHEPLQKRKKVG